MKKLKKFQREMNNNTSDEGLDETLRDSVNMDSNLQNETEKVIHSSSSFKLNLNTEDLYQGIILSEILGKPLSKRRNRRE